MTSTLYLPTLDKTILRPWFIPSQEALDEQVKIVSSKFFLVKQGTFGERLKCTNCNRRHDHITLKCIKRPFSGMTGGLYAYYRVVGDNRLEDGLNPGEKSRYNRVRSLLGNMPDLSKMHPQLAAKLSRELGVADEQLGAFALGVLEGISETEARKLVRQINDTGIRPKVVL